MFLVGYEHPTNTKLHRNQDLCTVYDCEKPLFYAVFGVITITLLRPKIDNLRQKVVDFTFSLLTLHFSLFSFETCRLGNK